MDKPFFINQAESRVFAIFSAYEKGADVPPAQVFRAEGFLEAGCSLGYISDIEAAELIRRVHKKVFKTELVATMAEAFHIPSLMKRAPVFPSTK